MEKKFSLTDTVALDEENDSVVIIDQPLLPGRVETIALTDAEAMFDAIKKLKVRGAPAIGVAAAMCLYILSKRGGTRDADTFLRELSENAAYLNSSRPTAVNLSWALERMTARTRLAIDKMRLSGTSEADIIDGALKVMRDEAVAISDEDIEACRNIGINGLSLIQEGFGILTHCNAGRLATVRYGTATAPMYLAHEKHMDIRVFCDETRPLLQGARLTAFELSEAGIDTTLICDNMASSLMKSGRVQAVFVGCDRVAANGDAANKIGTSGVAVLAKHYNIPFYVCAPLTTIDLATPTGADIVIEQRDASEVTELWYSERMAPDNESFSVYNPAFDVTDNSLISAIVTPKGVLRAPFDKALADVMRIGL